MKRVFSLLLCFVLLIGFSSVSIAENYQDKKFPSDQILAKMFNKYGDGRIFLNSVGKYKTSDNTYRVFFIYDQNGRQIKGIGSLISLDNGLWIFDYSKGQSFIVLEK